ncbi:zinc-dependent alcohol dehydrogenase family protein [Sulfitobacter sp.]|uniref:zinc-dependent alcohol dehydrogenase family protein n=1 Tax=Sulfitobacter sp. TaxID=1903071 RepID=UPI003001EF74
MKAMILNTYGEASKFEATDLAAPTVVAGQVVVRIASTSVNTVDTKICAAGNDSPLSPQLPALLGMDFAGTVTEVGEGVTDFAVGDEVYGCAGGLADLPGALAEFMLVDARLIAQKPTTISMREAAALPLVAITAYEGLIRAEVSTGQKVLVHGGTGGVGHVAVQLAKHFGAEVYSTVSNDKAAAIVTSFGAVPVKYKNETVADYVRAHTGGADFDVVYDTVGGENMIPSFEAAALNGQIATTVSMLELDLSIAHMKGLSIHVVFMLIPMLHDFMRQAHGDILREIATIVDAGAWKPLLDEPVFGLEQVGEAYARLSSGQAVGKVVVDV